MIGPNKSQNVSGEYFTLVSFPTCMKLADLPYIYLYLNQSGHIASSSMILKLALNILTLKKGTLHTSALAQSVPGDTRGHFSLYSCTNAKCPGGHFLGGGGEGDICTTKFFATARRDQSNYGRSDSR